ITAWIERVTDANRCGLGAGQRALAAGVMRFFTEEVIDHLGRRCPSSRVLTVPKIVDWNPDAGTFDYDEGYSAWRRAWRTRLVGKESWNRDHHCSTARDGGGEAARSGCGAGSSPPPRRRSEARRGSGAPRRAVRRRRAPDCSRLVGPADASHSLGRPHADRH